MLFIAADHAGFKLKEYLHHCLATRHVALEDFGTFSATMDDYPGYAKRVAKIVAKHDGKGILICGSGHGMAIAANRFKKVRAVNCWNQESARQAREEDDANILVLPARFLTQEAAWEITSVFLSTTFSYLDRYKRRIGQIDAL
jgi:ribose 5-phosphate isomerase B